MCCKNCLKIFSIIILILSILFYWSFDKSFKEIEIKDSKAKCLDGSNYKFLLSEGTGSGKNSFYIYFEGGGFCGTEKYDPLNTKAALEYCAIRATNRLGNNEYSFISKYIFKPLARYLSSSKFFNPNFYNWNKIYVKYCDGTMHLASLAKPIKYEEENKLLYVRGEDNVKEILNYLINEKNFKNAKNVLISGSSAGGVAAVYYSKYIRDLFPSLDKKNNNNKTVNLKVISDSGYFYRPNYSLKFGENRNVMRHMLEILQNNLGLQKTEIMTNINKCNGKEFIDCIFPVDYINNIKKDYEILFLTSSYDSWTLSRLLGTECMFGYNVYQNCNETEKYYFEKYSKEMLSEIKYLIAKDKNKKITAWINKGFFHTYLFYSWSWGMKSYGISGYSLEEFINQWFNENYDKNERIYYDGIIKEKLVDFFWVLCFADTDF